jgi:hypothetical protein
MPEDVRPETIGAIIGLNKKGQPTISDVKKQADDMGVIKGTINTARELSGAPALEQEIDRKDKKLEKVEQERDQAIADKHKAEIDSVRTDLGSKIDHLTESLQSGASRKTIADEIGDIKKAATELGMGGSKVSEIRDLMSLVETMNPRKNLVEQLKEAKELLSTLQPPQEKPKGLSLDGMPAEIVLQLKKMDTDLQVTLEQMRDKRQRDDHDFQITLKKWEEEREARRAEIEGKLTVERERNQLLAGGITMFGRAAGKGVADAFSESEPGIARQPSQPAQPPQGKSYHVELDEGEAATMQCQKCRSPIEVVATTKIAECLNCHEKYNVLRKAPSSEVTPEEEASSVI